MMMMMIIAPNSDARKEEKKGREVEGKYRRILGEEERDTDNEGITRPCQQDITPYEKEV